MMDYQWYRPEIEALREELDKIKILPPLSAYRWQVEVLPPITGYGSGYPVVILSVTTKDVTTGKDVAVNHRLQYMRPPGKDGVAQWVFDSMLGMLKHELGECFAYETGLPFFPHENAQNISKEILRAESIRKEDTNAQYLLSQIREAVGLKPGDGVSLLKHIQKMQERIQKYN